MRTIPIVQHLSSDLPLYECERCLALLAKPLICIDSPDRQQPHPRRTKTQSSSARTPPLDASEQLKDSTLMPVIARMVIRLSDACAIPSY